MGGVTEEANRYEGDAHAQTTLRVQTACGFTVDVLPDRCLDLGAAMYSGLPVAWMSGAPLRRPRDLPENSWRNRFVGGLLATCGLDNVGPACVDAGVTYPQHGRIGGEPARHVRWGTRCLGRRRWHWVTGETAQPGSSCVLRRLVIIVDDTPFIRVVDTVRNESGEAQPVMVQYHCNFGSPIVAPGGRVVVSGTTVTPRDAEAATALAHWDAIEPPHVGEGERVFRHEQRGRRWSEASLVPPPGTAGRGAMVRADRITLPWLWQWWVFAPEMYVVGLEPANCAIKPRDAARASGTLPMLDAGGRVRFVVEIAVTRSDVAGMDVPSGRGSETREEQ